MMRCDQARVLIGVRDELDTPTRRALHAHVESCRACAEVWLEEAEFLRLMAARSITPPPSPRIEARLLDIPARDLTVLRLRAHAARLGPPTLLVLGLALGAFWTVQRMGGAEDGADGRPVALVDPGALDPSALEAAQGDHPDLASRAPAPPVAARAAAITRQRRVDLREAADLGFGLGSSAKDARPAFATSRVDRASRLRDQAAAIGLSDRRGAPPLLSPAEATPGLPPTALPATAPPERSPAEVPPPPNPTAIPPPPDPATAPPASPTAVAWQLDVKVQIDDPSADLTGAGVVVQIETQVDGSWTTLYEEPMVFAGRVAEDRPRLDRPPPYEVELFSGLSGYALCPGESRTRTVDAGDLVDRRGEVRFHLCAQPAPVPEVTGSATATSLPATATAPPTITPGATLTPSPVDVTGARGR